MAEPIGLRDAEDSDIDWLVSSFIINFPDWFYIESEAWDCILLLPSPYRPLVERSSIIQNEKENSR